MFGYFDVIKKTPKNVKENRFISLAKIKNSIVFLEVYKIYLKKCDLK